MTELLLLPDAHGVRHPGGTYLLHIVLEAGARVTFGRAGSFTLPAGHFAYVGSALGRRGSSSLANRLLRHAARHVGRPQALRSQLAAAFGIAELELSRRTKRLHWHVDFLLEVPEARLAGVVAWCDGVQREGAVARWLAGQDELEAVGAGLGASDRRGETHLFFVNSGLVGWERVCRQAQNMRQ